MKIEEKSDKNGHDLFEKIDTLKLDPLSRPSNPLKEKGEFLQRQKTEPTPEKVAEHVPEKISEKPQNQVSLNKSNTSMNPLLEKKTNQDQFLSKKELEINKEIEVSDYFKIIYVNLSPKKKKQEKPKSSKPLFDPDEDNELMGWHDDSKPPTLVNETQNLTLPTKKKEEAKPKPSSKNAPMFEEESNDLMGWDNSDNPENPYIQIKSNPLLIGSKPIQTVIHTKQNKMEETGVKRESVQNTQKFQNVRSRYEEEDLSGWNN